MEDLQLKKYLSSTLQRVLEAIARIALRGEVSHKEFVEVSKRAFFRVARDDYGLAGRKTNLARVAILTGFSRKECTRLKELENTRSATVGEAMNPCTRVISGWYQDAEYLHADGTPKVIPSDGPGPSLAELIYKYAGDMPPRAVSKELQRMGVIENAGDQNYRITRRNFIPEGFDLDKVRILGNQLSDLGATIFHNLTITESKDARLQRYVVSEKVPKAVAERFQQLATEKSQELLEQLDLWLAEHVDQTDTLDQSKSKPLQRVGVGVYYFEKKSSVGDPE